MTIVLSLAAALLTLHVIAFFSRLQYGRGYERGLTDGIEIEASLREGRQPRWTAELARKAKKPAPQNNPQPSPRGDHHE